MLKPLPIDPFLPDLARGLQAQPGAVLLAEPGAGKSTRVPPALAATCGGLIFVLQPRRIAARAVAERIASENQWKLGEEIGYRIRFENRTTAKTRIVVMTEGILARIIQADPFLDNVSAVILDEFHERNLHTDIALALCREIQSTVRPDLKIVVMSATLDPKAVSHFLDNAPVIQVPGRTFPLSITYGPRVDQRSLEVRTVEAIMNARSIPAVPAPHILVFLPGMAEIRRVSDGLRSLSGSTIHILHSSVSAADQHAALAPSDLQKIILATNIAETSLTIDGVGLVIDSGLARVPFHDTRLGFDRLETRRISKASAMQRAGRAGRSGPGTCIRLFTLEEHTALADYDTPEIQRLDLAGVLLLLKIYGVQSPENFQWFEKPSAMAIHRARHLLRMLGALDDRDHLLDWGRALSQLPLHPRLASVYLFAARGGCLKEASWLCAMLEAGDTSPQGPRESLRESDPIDRLYEVMGQPSAASWSVRNAFRQLELLGKNIAVEATASDSDKVLHQALLRGFPDRLVRRRGKGDARGLMVAQRGVRVATSSRVIAAPFFVALDLRERDHDSESLVQSASSIEIEWLSQLFPQLWTEQETVRIQDDKVQGVRRSSFADLVLEEKELGRLPEGTDTAAIVRVQLMARHGSALSCFLSVPSVASWLGRYLFIQAHMPELDLPHLHLDSALDDACSICRNTTDFAAHALSCVQSRVPANLVRIIQEQAPEFLILPTGNRARINYPAMDTTALTIDATAFPHAAARVQELFGLSESPRLAMGRIALVLELLSPAMRPVQKTRDLKSFWNSTYQEVRKELRARYPKHPWPEDPWTALPVSIGRRRS